MENLYLNGFCTKCAEYNLDPGELMKVAEEEAEKGEKKPKKEAPKKEHKPKAEPAVAKPTAAPAKPAVPAPAAPAPAPAPAGGLMHPSMKIHHIKSMIMAHSGAQQ